MKLGIYQNNIAITLRLKRRGNNSNNTKANLE